MYFDSIIQWFKWLKKVHPLSVFQRPNLLTTTDSVNQRENQVLLAELLRAGVQGPGVSAPPVAQAQAYLALRPSPVSQETGSAASFHRQEKLTFSLIHRSASGTIKPNSGSKMQFCIAD